MRSHATPSRAHRLFTSFVPDRRELLPRCAMRVRCEPSPAYLAKLQERWRIVVPVSGRLSPAVVGEFETESEARTWLGSPEGIFLSLDRTEPAPAGLAQGICSTMM